MKKAFILCICALVAMAGKAQSTAGICVQVSCPIGPLQLPLDSTQIVSQVTLTGDTVSATIWKQLTGPTTATISTPTSATTWIKGMTSSGIYTFQVSVSTKHGNNFTNTSGQVTISPAAVTPVQRTVVSITLTVYGQTLVIPASALTAGAVLYSDGSKQ